MRTRHVTRVLGLVGVALLGACTGGDGGGGSADSACDGTGANECLTPPSPQCDGDTRIGYAETGTCENGTCVYDEVREPCDSGCAYGACVGPASLAIAEVRVAEPDTRLSPPIPVSGVVTYVLPEGAHHRGFFLQDEADGPALFVDLDWIETQHRDAQGNLLLDVPPVLAGDVVSFEVASVGDNFGMTHVHDVVPQGGVAWTFEGSRDPSTLVVDISRATDLRTDFERWESRLVSLTGTLALPIRTAGDPYSQWPIATEGMPDPPHGLLFRAKDDVLDAYPELAEGCEVTAVVPIWGYLNPDNGLDYAQATAYREADVRNVSCP